MADVITLVCEKCGRKADTLRCDTDPPEAVEMHGIVCPNCDTGGFDMPEYYDANGAWISGDPDTFGIGQKEGSGDE